MKKGDVVIDFVFVGLSFAIGVYVFAEYENLSFRMGNPIYPILSAALSPSCSYGSHKARSRLVCGDHLCCGVPLSRLRHLPATAMSHTGFSFEQIINFLFFSTDGILGPHSPYRLP